MATLITECQGVQLEGKLPEESRKNPFMSFLKPFVPTEPSQYHESFGKLKAFQLVSHPLKNSFSSEAYK